MLIFSPEAPAVIDVSVLCLFVLGPDTISEIIVAQQHDWLE